MKPKFYILILLISLLVACGNVAEDSTREVDPLGQNQINAPLDNPPEQEILEKAIDYYLDPAGYAYDEIGMRLTFTGSSAWAHVVGLGPICSSSDNFCEIEIWDSDTVAGPYIYFDSETEAWLSFGANLCEYPPERMYVAMATTYDEYWNQDHYFSDYVFASLAANQSSAVHADTGAQVGDILYRDGPPLGFGHAAIYYGKDKYGNDLLIESNTITDVCDNTAGGVRIVYADDSLAGNHWYGAFYPDTPIDWVDLIMDGECQLGSRYDFINTHDEGTCGDANGAFRCDGFTHYVYGEQGVDLSISFFEIPSPYSQMMRDNLSARRPKMISADVNPTIFEPSLGEVTSISLRGTNRDLNWTITIKNSSSDVTVRTVSGLSGKSAGYFWDGRDDGGTLVNQGSYTINVSASISGSAVSYYKNSSTIISENITVMHTATCSNGSPPAAICSGSCIPGWDFRVGEIVVYFPDSTSDTVSDTVIADILSELGGGSILREHHVWETHYFNNYYRLSIPSDVSIGCALIIARAYPEVDYADPVYLVHAFGTPPDIEDVDTDEDTIENSVDNCPTVHNISQTDIDDDGIGDACDPDKDGDGYLNGDDVFPLDASEWEDSDGDGVGDNTDFDDDGDGVVDSMDAFPFDPAEFADTDGDGIGDNADIDDDNDGVDDDLDVFPRDPLESTDNDGDRIGDNADPDDDNDGYSDEIETREGTDPLDNSSTPPDFDNDFDPDSTDPDDDNDGVPDENDLYPHDSSRWQDKKMDSPEEVDDVVADVVAEDEFYGEEDTYVPSGPQGGVNLSGGPILNCQLMNTDINEKDQALWLLVFVAIIAILINIRSRRIKT